MRPVNADIENKCPDGEHDTNLVNGCCPRCGALLCDICLSDKHRTGEGHDLNNPRYWGV